MPKPVTPQPCSFDETVGQIIHRFDHGARVCRCGQVEVDAAPAKIMLPALQTTGWD